MGFTSFVCACHSPLTAIRQDSNPGQLVLKASRSLIATQKVSRTFAAFFLFQKCFVFLSKKEKTLTDLSMGFYLSLSLSLSFSLSFPQSNIFLGMSVASVMHKLRSKRSRSQEMLARNRSRFPLMSLHNNHISIFHLFAAAFVVQPKKCFVVRLFFVLLCLAAAREAMEQWSKR